jgi:hypothetical protein
VRSHQLIPVPRKLGSIHPLPHMSSWHRNYLVNNRVDFPRGQSGRGLRLTTHKLILVSRKRGSIHPLSHTPSWHSNYVVNHRKIFFGGKAAGA